MRQFGKIETTFWTNPNVKPQSDQVKLLLAYLFACKHGNAVGCFLLPRDYIAADLKWPMEKVCETLSETVSLGFVEYDEETDLLWLTGWWGHNSIENQNVAKAAAKSTLLLPRKSRVYRLFFNDLYAQTASFHPKVWEELKNGIAHPSENGSANPIETKEPEPKPEPKPEREPELPAIAAGREQAVEARPAEQSPSSDADGGKVALHRIVIPNGDYRSSLFNQGLAYVADTTGKTPTQCRPMVGAWLKESGDDARRLWEILVAAQREQKADLRSWVPACLRRRGRGGADPGGSIADQIRAEFGGARR